MSQIPPSVPSPSLAVRPHRGAMILTFGILSWFLCFIFGVVAWVMGKNDLDAMASGQMDPSGDGLTRAGKIIGMIHIIIMLVVVGIWLLILTLGAVLAVLSHGAS